MIGLKLKRLGFYFLSLLLSFNPFTICSQAASNLGRYGDPLQAFQAPFQKDNLQSLVLNVATAGLMAKFGPPSTSALLKAHKTPVFSDFVRYNAARSAFNTGLNMAITGKPLERALKDGALQFAGNTLGGYGSYQIGQSYGQVNLDGTPKDSNISYGEHKLLHGVVGGLTGGILNASKSSKEIKQGVISGATGAMAAEIAGEEILKHKLVNAVEEDIRKTGKIPSPQRIADLSVQAAKDTKIWANVIGSSTGAFVGKDSNTAYWAADNALENNFGVATPLLAALYYSPQLAQLCLRYGPEVVAKLVQQGISLIDLFHTVEKKSYEITGKLAKQEAGKQATSTTGGPGLEPEKEPKKDGVKKTEEKQEIEITLKHKEGTNLQAFNRKTEALQDLADRGKLYKADSVRDPKVTLEYRRNIMKRANERWGKTDPEKVEKIEKLLDNMDADHMQDLQLGGTDHISMLNMLDQKVNRS